MYKHIFRTISTMSVDNKITVTLSRYTEEGALFARRRIEAHKLSTRSRKLLDYIMSNSKRVTVCVTQNMLLITAGYPKYCEVK